MKRCSENDGNEIGEYYTDNGWCRKHKEHRDPGDYCDDFHCFNVKGGDPYYE